MGTSVAKTVKIHTCTGVARQSNEAQADHEEEGDLKVFSLITPFLDHTYNTAQDLHLGHILTSFLASM